MCFIVNENNTEVLIADKNIVCYKITYNVYVDNKGFRSIIQGFRYNFNELYKTNALYHTKYKRELYKGFHSYINKPFWFGPSIRRIIKCIIPKGARYLKNPETGEYISNMIIPEKVVANKY